MSANYEGYVRVLGEALREAVREAIEAGPRTDFDTGYLMGFHRVVTLMQQTADIYEIPPDALGIADIDEGEFCKPIKGPVA